MYWHGNEVHIRNPRHASALGIETVYQDLALCDNLNVIQNLFLGREPTSFGVLDEAAMEAESARTMQRLAVTTLQSLDQRVGSLSGGQRQAVAIARSLLWHSQLVILDERTASLGVSQTEVVLTLARRLAGEGVGVILISHNMNDVFRVADRIAVLYLGQMVGVIPVGETDPRHIVELMTLGELVSRSRPVTDNNGWPSSSRASAVVDGEVAATTSSP